jgi:hypothetical protein
MRDFYAEYPFPEVVLKIAADPEKFCEIGDIITGMDLMSSKGRVERFIEDGIVVHPMDAKEFYRQDILVSPTATTRITCVAPA